MKWFCLAFLLISTDAQQFLSDEYIEYLNKQNLPWKAGRNFDPAMTVEDVKMLLGVKSDNHLRPKLPLKTFSDEIITFFETFDARQNWPNCKSISMIRDQSKCASSWAVAAVGAMSDRICIHTKGKNQTLVSAANLLGCCDDCGEGCGGGYPGEAWWYWASHGIVSGGEFDSSYGCQDYPFPKCSHYKSGNLKKCSKLDKQTATCSRKCSKNYNSSYEADLTYGTKPYGISSWEGDIENEISINGPVEATFDVYYDFLFYKSGVYKRKNDTRIGEHAVKIIGWGVEDHEYYWLCANSWNENWGDKGFFKITKGSNHCGIESNVVAGIPYINDSTSFRILSNINFILISVIPLFVKLL